MRSGRLGQFFLREYYSFGHQTAEIHHHQGPGRLSTTLHGKTTIVHGKATIVQRVVECTDTFR